LLRRIRLAAHHADIVNTVRQSRLGVIRSIVGLNGSQEKPYGVEKKYHVR